MKTPRRIHNTAILIHLTFWYIAVASLCVRTSVGSSSGLPAPLAEQLFSTSTSVVHQGFLKRELYLNIPGSDIASLTNAAKFPNAPDTVTDIGLFEAPSNIGDNYGQRISGFVTPPVTGAYKFYIASDDQSALFLSTDADPAHKKLLCSEPGWNSSRDWTGTARRPNKENISPPVTLVAGQTYYIEALHKENNFGDNLAVAWQKPGDPVPALNSSPIPGTFLKYVVSRKPVILSEPRSQDLVLHESTQLQVGIDGAPPLTFQWNKDGVPIGNATARSLTIPDFSSTSPGGYTVVVKNSSGSVTSQVAEIRWASTFKNPILPTSVDTADPHITFQNGWYYLIGEQFNNPQSIFLRKSRSLLGLRSSVPEVIGIPSLPAGRSGCFAPELHFLQGKWYIFFQSPDTSIMWNDRLFVAQSTTQLPEGPYVLKGQLAAPGADFFAIDVSILEQDGALYLLWSGLSQAGDLISRLNAGDHTRIFMAPLLNPWTISGSRVDLSSQMFPWEGVINEAPAVLRHNGKLHISYSANGYGPNYCLGLLTFKGGSMLDPNNWTKSPAPLFRRYSDESGEIVGTGHCAFTQSLDGTQDWIVFHNLFPADVNPDNLNYTREVRFQPISWNSNDEPFFGHPFPAPVNIPGPSGEAAPIVLPYEGGGVGLRADYFSNINLAGASISRIDPAVDFDWWSGAPIAVPNGDNFSVRWSGFVLPRYSDTYTFHTVTDDGVRLWINDQLLVDDWNGHPAKENTGTISLNAGLPYRIRMEYFEGIGDASARLYWSSTSQVKEIIPQSQLFPTMPPSRVQVTITPPEAILGGAQWRLDGAIGKQVDRCHLPSMLAHIKSPSLPRTVSILPVH